MNMKKLVALVALAASTFASAQELSLTGGVSKLDERSEGEQFNHSYGPMVKFNYVQWIALNDARFSINPGLSAGFYTSKLYETEDQLMLSYVSLPVELVYKVKPVGSSFFVSAGGYFSYLIGAESDRGELRINDGDYSYKNTDYGINVGVGYVFDKALTLRAGYTKGLANNLNYPEGQTDSYVKNSNFGLTIGYMIFRKRI